MSRISMLIATGMMFVGTLAPRLHPGHESFAEIELNRRTGNLQVALCVWPEDLESALRKFSHTAVSLDDADVDKTLVAYLKKRFIVRAEQDGAPLGIRWVGKELDLKKTWLYFEVLDAADGAVLRLEHRLLLGEVDQQQNYVAFRDGDTRTSMLFDQDHPIRDLRTGQTVSRGKGSE